MDGKHVQGKYFNSYYMQAEMNFSSQYRNKAEGTLYIAMPYII